MNTTAEYKRLRAKGWHAAEARRASLVNTLFAALEDEYVKLEAEPEIDVYDDSYIDTWDVSEAQRNRERSDVHRRLEREGHWILVAYWRPDPDAEWQQVDSVGGFIGDDYLDSGYDVDLRRSALDALDAYRSQQACELARRPTYAGASC